MKLLKQPAVSLFSAPAPRTSQQQQDDPQEARHRQQVTDADSVSQRRVQTQTLTTGQQVEPASNTSKFHRAALDGYIDMLCDASRRDTNLASRLEGLTPTLLAAHSGQLEALRILVGRGGDPERTTTSGSSGLHLAAARGHLNCVSFLVNFGVNMWALDNDLHTAKDVAAIEQRQEVLNYLDQMMAKQSALNTKSVQKLKERAKAGAEKRLKQMRKAQLKAIKQIERDERYLARLSSNRRLLKSAHSISDIRLVCKSASAAPPAGSSVASSLVGSDKSSLSNYSSSLVSSSPIGSLMAAVNRQSSASGAKAPAPRLFRPSLKPPVATMTAGHSLLNQSSAASSPPSPLVDNQATSAHSSLSSSFNSTAFLADSRRHQLSRQQQQGKSNRPKYSELVAIRKFPDEKSPSTAAVSSVTATTASSSNATIGSRLTKGLGGVSRKVQLRKFLQIGSACSTSDLTAAVADSSEGRADEKQPGGGGQSSANSAAIRWPPAPTLSRAVSVPDFGQTDQQEAHTSDQDRLHCSSSQHSGAPEVAQQPKTRDDGPTKTALRDESQHKLLTRCLSQLKMRHERAASSSSNKQSDSGTDNNNQRLMPLKADMSDELLLHQRLNGGLDEQPIRPSAIKQQQLVGAAAGGGGGRQPEVLGAVGSIDSIGSAGSLVMNASRSSNSMVTSSPSSTSFSSSASSSSSAYAKSSAAARRHTTHLDSFLESSGLLDLSEVFAREKIDLEALMLLTEDDMKSLQILLGPRRKLLKAIEDRRRLLAAPSNRHCNNSKSTQAKQYVMVDTPL